MVRFLGFMLTKISAEKFVQKLTDLKIASSINVKNIEENPVSLSSEKERLLGVSFSYSINYSKDIAKIEFEGKLIISVDPETEKEILKKWKKKEIEDSLKMDLFNMILMKAGIKALQLEEDLGLPTHFRMPSLTPQKK